MNADLDTSAVTGKECEGILVVALHLPKQIRPNHEKCYATFAHKLFQVEPLIIRWPHPIGQSGKSFEQDTTNNAMAILNGIQTCLTIYKYRAACLTNTKKWTKNRSQIRMNAKGDSRECN